VRPPVPDPTPDPTPDPKPGPDIAIALAALQKAKAQTVETLATLQSAITALGG